MVILNSSQYHLSPTSTRKKTFENFYVPVSDTTVTRLMNTASFSLKRIEELVLIFFIFIYFETAFSTKMNFSNDKVKGSICIRRQNLEYILMVSTDRMILRHARRIRCMMLISKFLLSLNTSLLKISNVCLFLYRNSNSMDMKQLLTVYVTFEI